MPQPASLSRSGLASAGPFAFGVKIEKIEFMAYVKKGQAGKGGKRSAAGRQLGRLQWVVSPRLDYTTPHSSLS